jgi:hypothetical protein
MVAHLLTLLIINFYAIINLQTPFPSSWFSLKTFGNFGVMKKIIVSVNLLVKLIIISLKRKSIMDEKKKTIVTLVVQFITSLLAVLLGINL